MLRTSLIACALVSANVVVHAAGIALLLRSPMSVRIPTRFWSITWLLVRVTVWLTLIHLVEISIWAMFYLWHGCFPDAESALYFSGVTYAAIGYGDLLLPEPWRILGPVEGLTGILMCGLSAGLLFAVMSRIYASRFGDRSKGNP